MSITSKLPVRSVALFACVGLVAALPATAAPLPDGSRALAGTWKCTYRAGAMRVPYVATWAYDRDASTLRQVDAFTGAGAEELVTFDAQHALWTAVVVDDHGTTTVMHASGKDPAHLAYRSVYPDASVAVTFDQVSATKYLLHGSVRSGGKTTVSLDTCVRSASP